MEHNSNVFPALKCILLAFKRSYRRYILAGFLITLSILTTLQLINDNQSKHVLIYDNIHRISSITTSKRNIDVILPRSDLGAKNGQAHATRPIESSLSKITPKPELKHLINASKTQYPLTVNAPFLLENPNLCSSVPNLSVLVIVHTAPNHFDRRQSIRETWTNATYYPQLGSVRVLFLLGRVRDADLQTKMENEFKEHSDLLQGDFIDAYRNLTHKGVMGYKWIAERCRNAKFVLKVDDDVIVNMFKFFMEEVPKFHNKQKQIMCNHILPGTMLIIRDKKSKWHVDDNHFKGKKFYPRYCSGFMVMITNDAIPAIYRSATMTPFFWVDDVYLYGLAPGNVPGIKYNGLKKGSHELNGQLAVKCYRNASRTCNYLVTGAGKREVMIEIWSNMVHLYEKEKMKNVLKPVVTETTVSYETSTGFSLDDKNKSKEQIAKENETLSKIMNGKNLKVGKVMNKMEINVGNKFSR